LIGSAVLEQSTVKDVQQQIVQHGDDFRPGPAQHTHPAQPGLATNVKISSQVKIYFYVSY